MRRSRCSDMKFIFSGCVLRVSVFLVGILMLINQEKSVYADNNRDQAKEAQYTKTLELKSSEAATHFHKATEALDKQEYKIAVKEYNKESSIMTGGMNPI